MSTFFALGSAGQAANPIEQTWPWGVAVEVEFKSSTVAGAVKLERVGHERGQLAASGHDARHQGDDDHGQARPLAAEEHEGRREDGAQAPATLGWTRADAVPDGGFVQAGGGWKGIGWCPGRRAAEGAAMTAGLSRFSARSGAIATWWHAYLARGLRPLLVTPRTRAG